MSDIQREIKSVGYGNNTAENIVRIALENNNGKVFLKQFN
jgi:hypothetical protein